MANDGAAFLCLLLPCNAGGRFSVVPDSQKARKVKRLLLVLVISSPIAAQWTTFDAANYGINLHNLEQAIADGRRALEYYQMARDAAAFVHNPAAFIAEASAIADMAVTDAANEGWTTKQRAKQIESKLKLGRTMMNNSAGLTTISHGNATNMQRISEVMQTASEELARINKKMRDEERSKHYMERNQYQDQGEVIASWRLK